jgi:hypothetical protein
VTLRLKPRRLASLDGTLLLNDACGGVIDIFPGREGGELVPRQLPGRRLEELASFVTISALEGV